jgi:uncharacterized protein
MDNKQIELIACPECQGKLNYDKTNKELVCEVCKVAYPVNDGIPVMLIEEARKIESAS